VGSASSFVERCNAMRDAIWLWKLIIKYITVQIKSPTCGIVIEKVESPRISTLREERSILERMESSTSLSRQHQEGRPERGELVRTAFLLVIIQRI
jgi:hypothetical protein